VAGNESRRKASTERKDTIHALREGTPKAGSLASRKEKHGDLVIRNESVPYLLPPGPLLLARIGELHYVGEWLELELLVLAGFCTFAC
jgi:hypothetical protein